MDASDELLQKAHPSALMSLDGVIRHLNDPMASALGRPAEQCVDHEFADLLSADQRGPAGRLLAQAATGRRLAMSVLGFPGSTDASLLMLVEARPVDDSAGGERLVWVESLDTRHDLSSLLRFPFRLAATAAGLGVWAYSHLDDRLEWVGGASEIAELVPEPSVSLSWVMARVQRDDQRALRRLASRSAESPWVDLRLRTEDDRWHYLACQVRRVHLGYGRPVVAFVVVRDETEQKTHREKANADLAAARERASLIAEFSSALIASTTEEEWEQVILTGLAGTFESAGALLGLVHGETLRVYADAEISTDMAEILQGPAADEQGPLLETIRTGEPLLIEGPQDYMRRWPHGTPSSLIQPGGTALVASLGRVDDQPLGAWAVVYGHDHRPSKDELALMDSLANLAGQGLRRIRAQQARLDLAIEVQKSMFPRLPERLPGLEVAARYRPSRGGLEIGGDWYDAYALPSNSVALVIGDVQGHDVEAAAFMGRISAMIRALPDDEQYARHVLTHINNLLITTNAARFASCTVLHVDPSRDQVTGTSAGHVPLLYAHKDGSHAVYTLPGGPVLGIVPDADYPLGTFTLDRDSVLIMVTDGLVEGPSLTLDAGLENVGNLAAGALQQGLSTEAIADRILEAVDAVDHLDDEAVLVIRRE